MLAFRVMFTMLLIDFIYRLILGCLCDFMGAISVRNYPIVLKTIKTGIEINI